MCSKKPSFLKGERQVYLIHTCTTWKDFRCFSSVLLSFSRSRKARPLQIVYCSIPRNLFGCVAFHIRFYRLPFKKTHYRRLIQNFLRSFKTISYISHSTRADDSPHTDTGRYYLFCGSYYRLTMRRACIRTLQNTAWTLYLPFVRASAIEEHNSSRLKAKMRKKIPAMRKFPSNAALFSLPVDIKNRPRSLPRFPCFSLHQKHQ